MPAYLPPISRRKFLATTLLATSGYLFGFRKSYGSSVNSLVDNDYFVLIADTHIDQNLNATREGENMADNLRLIVQRILEDTNSLPAGVIINGDAANRDGKPQEYANIKNILTPLSEADIPVYITMGNHDRRDTFFAAFPDYKKESPFVNGRHIDIIETPHTYLFLLDTLEVVNNTPGILGTHQREWLTETLSSHNDKPVILIGHHYPWANIQNGNWRGLKDYAELLENFPNPVHSKTVISYELAITSPVLLQVFNSDGRLIKTLVQKEKQNAGFHKVNFDAAELPDGAYVYRLNVGGKVLADTMFVTK